MSNSSELSMSSGQVMPNAAAQPSFWRRIGARIEWAGEWLNPLLVKEVRQSLKSRQFSITFTAVLCLSWLWSIIGIARLGPDVAYGVNGPEMFYGYYMILAFPLLLLVPYSAYRSLIAEREDNTYELVAITALRPRQIVGGKLGSAVAQMAVYFSAVAPCLAFTYLLRGIDIPTIFWIMFYTFLASLGFSLIALLLATIAKEKHWQVMLAVVIVVLLFWCCLRTCESVYELLRTSRLPFRSAEFWLWNLIFLSFYVSTFVLFYLAAAAQLTFTAENRSTPLRWAMLCQQLLWVGWMSYGLFRAFDNTRGAGAGASVIGLITLTVSAVYWFIMGSFMLGEPLELSPRVKRRLPATTFGRAFLTWLNPGPGPAYLFALCNVVVTAILAFAAVWYSDSVRIAPGGMPATWLQMAVIVLMLCYFTIYLGLANLLLRLLRKVMQINLGASAAISVLLVLAGWGIPTLLDPFYLGNSSYNFGHITDPFWTCAGTLEGRLSAQPGELLIVLVPTALVVLLLNLVYIVPEVRQHRIAPPTRVAEEEQSQIAAQQPPAVQSSSPWDT